MEYVKVLVDSWKVVETHPRLLIPKVASVVLSALWLFIAYTLWQQGMAQDVPDAALMGIAVVYLLVEACIIFYFTGMSYGFYHDLFGSHRKKKVNLSVERAMRFAHDEFMHIAGISMFMYLVLGIPALAILLAVFGALLGEINLYLGAFYVALLAAWIVLVSWRLLFVFPMLASSKPGKHVIKASAHFTKIHLRHTITSWIIVMTIVLLGAISGKAVFTITAFEIWLAVIGGLCAICAEMIIAVWEQVVLFELYVESKVVKVKKK